MFQSINNPKYVHSNVKTTPRLRSPAELDFIDSLYQGEAEPKLAIARKITPLQQRPPPIDIHAKETLYGGDGGDGEANISFWKGGDKVTDFEGWFEAMVAKEYDSDDEE